jgi:hypothetical protein
MNLFITFQKAQKSFYLICTFVLNLISFLEQSLESLDRPNYVIMEQEYSGSSRELFLFLKFVCQFLLSLVTPTHLEVRFDGRPVEESVKIRVILAVSKLGSIDVAKKVLFLDSFLQTLLQITQLEF